MITIKIITIAMAALILILVVELIRREKLTFKYGLPWFMLSLCAIFFAVYDEVISRLAFSLGFELPSNFIFFTLLSAIVFLVLLMTLFLCQQNRHNDIIAQKVALLEFEIKNVKEKTSLDDQEKS